VPRAPKHATRRPTILMEQRLVDKKDLTEQEIRTRYITPAIRGAGWPHNQIREALLALSDALAAEVAAAEEVRARLLQAVLNRG